MRQPKACETESWGITGRAAFRLADAEVGCRRRRNRRPRAEILMRVNPFKGVLIMKRYFAATAAVSGIAVAALDLAGPARAAVPTGGSNAQTPSVR